MVVLDVQHTEKADIVQDSDDNGSSDEEGGGEEEMEVEEEENGRAGDENGTSTKQAKKEKVEKGVFDEYKGLTTAQSKKGQVDFCSKILRRIKTKTSEHPYVLKRLVLGLASESAASRQNHYVCLVEFLRENSIAFSDIDKAVEQNLYEDEKSQYYLGRILASIAILRSGIRLSEEDTKRTVDGICKHSLKESSWCILALKGIADYMAINKEISADIVLDCVSKIVELKISDAKLDSLYFICSLMNSRNLEFSVTTKYFDFKDASKNKFAQNAVRILINSNKPIKLTTSHPALKELASLIVQHSITKNVFDKLLSETKNKDKAGRIAVFLAVHLLKISPESHEDILSGDMLQTLLILSKKDKNAVTPMSEVLEDLVKEDKIASSILLPKLLKCSNRWEKIVPGKLVSLLLAKADKELVDMVENEYMKTFSSDGEVIDRVHAAEMLVKLSEHPTNYDISKRVVLLNSLFENAFIDTAKTSTSFHPLPQEAKPQLKGVFFRALDSHCKTFADNVNLLSGCMTKAMELCSKDQLKGGAEEIWPKLTKLVKSLHKNWQKNETKETGMFLLLFSNIGLQLFHQPAIAVDILSELFPLHTEWSKTKSSKRLSSANTAEKPSEYEVVVEILISLLAENNHLLRNLATTIFKIVSSQMNKTAIQSLLDAFGGEEEQEDAEEEMEDEEVDDEEKTEQGFFENIEWCADDNEVENESDGSDVEEDGDDTEGEIDEEEDSSDEDDDDLNDSTIKNIQSALGEHAEAEEEDDDIDMDQIPDEEMNKLDEKLAMAFKALGGKNTVEQKKKEQRENMAKQHFKLRVLELIEIYIQHSPSIENICIIVPSLLERYQQLYTNLNQFQLTNKVKSVLKKVILLKLEPAAGFDTTKLLQYLITFNCNKTYHAMNLVQIVPKLCLQVLKISLNEYSQESEKLYLDTVKEYYGTRGAFVNYELFVGAVSVAWSGAQKIVQEVLEKTFSPGVKPYHFVQGIIILKTYLQNSKIKESFPKECKQLNKKIISSVLSNLTENLNKSKPNQLIELFDMFRVFKQQALLGDDDIATVKSALEAFSTLGSKFTKLPKVKKGLRKILLAYEVDIKVMKADSKSSENKNGDAEAKTGKDDTAKDNDDGNKDSEKKKSKKKKKKNKKKEKVETEDALSAPSFADFVVDTTEVYVEPEKPETKSKEKKKKRKSKPEKEESSGSTKKVKSSE